MFFAGALLGTVMPFNGKTMMDAMFTEGGLGGKPGKAGACSCMLGGLLLESPLPCSHGRAASAAAHTSACHACFAGAKGGLRTGQSRRRTVGPQQLVKIQHGTDGADLELLASCTFAACAAQ